MKLSLGVLSYNVSDVLHELTGDALASYRSADELIHVENGGRASNNPVDVYVHITKNRGFTAGVNTILRVARGEYIAVASNDTRLESGNLYDLCIPGTVTSPVISTQPHITPFSGAFFVVPRTILEDIGFLDEDLFLYWSDEEYLRRLREANIPVQQVPSVTVWHGIAKTVSVTESPYDDEKTHKAKYGHLTR